MPQTQNPGEIVVISRPSAQLRAAPNAHVRSAEPSEADALNAVLKANKISLMPMFDLTEELVAARMSPRVMPGLPPELDPSLFYSVVGDVKNVDKLLADLLKQPSVEAAYYKPPGEPPVMYREDLEVLRSAAPGEDLSPAPTPDFSGRQGYLEAAPTGVDARFAWSKPGGRGDNVRVIDLEWGWNFTHEDLLANSGGLLDGTNGSDTDHGTAVLGVIGADDNQQGVLGIAHNAALSAISFNGNSSAAAIRKAADRLSAGDIILLEIHRPGPNATGSGQQGYIAIEWWPDDFAAIRYATNKGIVVVEAAGNGAQDLDAAIYSTRPTGFPSSWTNPFNRNNPQCGAILVGAGAPPEGTHGRDYGPARSRLDFSNYGSAVDVQGWGREVTTTGRSWGVADLYNGGPNAWYTDQFSGTSSASPIVTGVLACAQGWLKAAGKALLTPDTARQVLRATGSAQQDATGRPASQRIGKLPDLRQIHASLFPKSVVKDAKDRTKDSIKDAVKDRKEKSEVKELKDRVKEHIKDRKDVKEFKEIEKPRKELKEIEKSLDQIHDIRQRIQPAIHDTLQPTQGTSLKQADRLEVLEATVAELVQILGQQCDIAADPHAVPKFQDAKRVTDKQRVLEKWAGEKHGKETMFDKRIGDKGPKDGKDVREGGDMFGSRFSDLGQKLPAAGDNQELLARLATLEAAMLELAQMLQGNGEHFIDESLRPDVAGASMQDLQNNLRNDGSSDF